MHEAGLLEESFDSDKDDQSMPENLDSVGVPTTALPLVVDAGGRAASELEAWSQEAKGKLRRIQALQNLPRPPLAPTSSDDEEEDVAAREAFHTLLAQSFFIVKAFVIWRASTE